MSSSGRACRYATGRAMAHMVRAERREQRAYRGDSGRRRGRGSTDEQKKRDAMLGFARGEVPVLVTKPKIAGFGMNWQKCARQVFAAPP